MDDFSPVSDFFAFPLCYIVSGVSSKHYRPSEIRYLMNMESCSDHEIEI